MGVSAVNPKTAPHLADSISEVRAYKAILSYKGEPVCVANATSSLTPSFLSAGSGSMEPTDEELDGLQCNTEDMNRIYTIAQNSILVDDPEKGVEISAVFIPYVALCVSSAVAGGLLTALGYHAVDYQPANPKLTSFGLGMAGGGTIHGISLLAEKSDNATKKGAGALSKKPHGIRALLAVTCGMAGAFSVQYLLSAEQ